MKSQNSLRERIRHFHEQHELKLDALFFLCGFVFDIFATKEGVDHLAMILQQVLYLALIGTILFVDFVREARPGEFRFSPRLERLWAYRGLALHFFLGTLMNIYSIFFLMSASAFSSILFVVLLLASMVLNEMKAVRQSGVDIKIGLYVICVFCFFSLLVPVLLGHVGLFPFLLSFGATIGVLLMLFYLLRKRLSSAELSQRLLLPGFSVSGLFLVFYLIGLIPPVPISAKKLGIYHKIEKQGDEYVLFDERPWWKIWQSGDQDFVAQPGDKIYFFMAIFSPARFDDEVWVHWTHHDERHGWSRSDKLLVHIAGGRKGGYRGFTTKQNFDEGDWRASVETSDGREIGRMNFHVTKVAADPGRVLTPENY